MIKSLKRLENNFSIFKAASIVGFLGLASRIVGLARNMIFASRFGAGDVLDAYLAAFRIPDFIFNLFILGTLSVAFIPVFAEWLGKDNDRAYKIANTVLNTTAVLMFLICGSLLIFVRPLTQLLVPGFVGEKLENVVALTKIFLLSPLIFTLSSVFGSILQAQKKFFIASLAPILYNLGIIFGVLALYPKFGIIGLGWGVIFGAIMHLLAQVLESARFGFRWQPVLDVRDEAVKKIVRLFVPRIIGLDISQISLIIATIIGSFLASGTITEFSFSNDFNSLAIGVFAIALATASFPVLCEQYAKRDEQGYLKTLFDMIAQILFFMLPISILILTFRAHIIRLTLGYGKFDWSDTEQTFRALGVMSLSLFAQGLTPLLSRAFYARQNTIVPVIVNILAIVLDGILAFIFGRQFGVVGIAAAFSIACVFNALALFAMLRVKLTKEIPLAPTLLKTLDYQLFIQTVKIISASLVMGVIGHYALYAIEPLLNTHTVAGLLVQATFAGSLACLAFLLTAKITGLKQADIFLRFFGKFSFRQK